MKDQIPYEGKAPRNPQIFGNAGIEYIRRYGAHPDHLAKIAEKNHRHRYDDSKLSRIH